MDNKFFAINRWMKQLYYANRQWFRVRAHFERLSDGQQRRLFAVMLKLNEPLAEIQRLLAEMQEASNASATTA
jgi:hypothetical protein